MTAPCGCCEGTEPLTPVPAANRPGLPALSYRVGTHATFLETMKARLSSLYLEIPEEALDERGRQKVSRIYPLRDLKTRASDDPAIAWLDAWATVGDVLTFYQERIANEGYLRTATERRSILELARLIGYALRPGVASTVYLAYTLDEDRSVTPPKPTAVTIAAGARSQSVPGPGELPQSFETSEDLEARSEWNNLQVRLTQPQQITPDTRTIYFKGIATNLKPGDPILIVASAPRVYRVESVTPDPPADRTKVTVTPWLPESVAAREQLIAAPRALADAVREITERFSDTAKAGVSPAARTTKLVLDQLQGLRAKLTPTISDAELKTLLHEEVLPKIKDVHRAAVEGGFTRLEPWVRSLAAELEAAAAGGSTGDPGASVTSRGVTSLPSVLTALAKPPSIPPPNSLRLPRSVDQSFAPNTDIAPQLLATLRPELREILYKAWENVPVTPEPAVEVYALRTRASVFGHNAPLEPIKNSDGVIIGSKEWDLQKPAGTAAESFEITMAIGQVENIDPGGSPEIQTTITLGGNQTKPLTLQKSAPTIIELPDAKDKVTATLTLEKDTVRVEFTFEARPIVVTVDVDLQTGQFRASSKGSDPTVALLRLDSDHIANEMIVSGALQRPSGRVNTEESNVVWLDAPYDQIRPDSWVVLERPGPSSSGAIAREVIGRARDVSERSRAEYGITGKSTRIELDQNWIDPDTDTFEIIRGTAVFAQSELLTLAEEPIEAPVCGDKIELDGLYDGLQSGRWLIVSGERTDVIPDDNQAEVTTSAGPADVRSVGQQASINIKGVPASELVMLAGVEQDFEFEGKGRLPGDKTHSRLLLAAPLKYCYSRDTAIIYGNVVEATHGETRNEVLGSGDGSKPLQQFTLRQPPLTFVSAANPAGVDSTLQVRVNDVLWHETDSLAALLPTDRKFITKTGDDGKTTVIFGTGQRGARLPTGQENVKAVYRNGIGKPGNVKAGQISLLASRPLGVKAVTNPLGASGGADKENRDQARQNAPLAVMALDRLVSTQDYADFASTFAGIGKASAARLSDGRRQLVHVTIAGADDIPIEKTSDLYRNLCKALRDFGDPYLPIQVDVRELLVLVISAHVQVLPDYQLETVEPKIRSALLDGFSFERRDLGQDALLSQAISIMQRVEGVAYVDTDVFAGIPSVDPITGLPITPAQIATSVNGLETDPKSPYPRVPAKLAEMQEGRIRPAQLAFLTPDVPATLILNEAPA